VFPLAIPLLSGPGAIATTLLLTSQADGDYARLALLAAVIVVVFGIAWALLRTADSLMARLGEGKIHILTRVLGIVLAALAVQYVLDGPHYRLSPRDAVNFLAPVSGGGPTRCSAA
jgi:multiple antibiotic resistance protein